MTTSTNRVRAAPERRDGAINDLGAQAVIQKAGFSPTAASTLPWTLSTLELLWIRCSPEHRFGGPRETPQLEKANYPHLRCPEPRV